jgi:hypothetical protein
MSTVIEAPAERPFTPTDYQLEIPGMDGYRADKLTVSFGGGVELQVTEVDDLDFLKTLTLGRTVSLKVEAVVVRKGFTLTLGSEEKADQAGYGVGLKVHSLEVA